MMSDFPQEAEVGPWAKQKLDALERYLDYYTTRLKKQRQWRTIYVDAFAGGGIARVRQNKRVRSEQFDFFEGLLGPQDPEQAQFVLGSPRRSLDLPNPFDSYIFIDADSARIAMLNALKAEYAGTRRITVRRGSAATEIDWIISKRPDPAKHRGVAFLDPFGAHLEWRSVRALADTRVFEVLINFPLDMAINRLIKVDGQIPASWRDQLNAFFPAGWWDHAYSTDPGLLAGLVDEGSILEKRRDARARLLGFYCQSLREAFGHVSQPKLIRNTKGHPLYYLIWAGPHPAGLKGANYVLSMGEKAAS
ncbi:three-Cys-motif partner protein TcmP [Phenylobacterium sp.]|uniref:three-Cys-motif partner protein TcmP n=1 Tax=Phenylobacterium sp. TaxID=1871053 RepID=UPI00391CDB98